MTTMTDARFDEIRKLNARPSETCDAHTLGQYIDANRDLINEVLALRSLAAGDETLFGNLEVRMAGYYFGFAQTGVKPVDAILSAVACAGKAYHHTNGWEDDTEPYEDIHRGASPVLWIQHAASDCAELISRLSASYSAACGERDEARAEYKKMVGAYDALADQRDAALADYYEKHDALDRAREAGRKILAKLDHPTASVTQWDADELRDAIKSPAPIPAQETDR